MFKLLGIKKDLGMPEGRKLPKEILTENFSNLGEDINIQIQEGKYHQSNLTQTSLPQDILKSISNR